MMYVVGGIDENEILLFSGESHLESIGKDKR